MSPAMTFTSGQIREEIKKLIARVTEREPEEILDEAHYMEELGVDSLMAMEVMIAIDKKFKIDIPEEEFNHATNVNASVASLVALRGFELDPDPRARLDRSAVRALFEGPGAEVSKVSLSRRDGRRFIHVSVEVSDVRRLGALAPFAWSSYRFDREGDVMEFRQAVGPSAGRQVNAGWTGREVVAFRMHLPSEIPFHNSPGGVQRGNILEWEQPLADRLTGAPLDLQVQLEPESILYTTLLLFGSTVVAAAATFALLIWWVARRGRHGEMAESRS